MSAVTLEEQKKRLAQRKAKLQQQEALLKIKERKQKLSKQIRIGELAEKAGILEWDAPTLLGAFLSLAEKTTNTEIVKTWSLRGQKDLELKPAPAKAETKELQTI